MSRAAVLSPTTLLGREVRDLLHARREHWQEVALLSTDEAEVGTVTEAGGAAALVSAADAGALEGIDVLLACGALADDLPLVEARPAGTTAILLAPDATAATGRPVIAGVNPEGAVAGEILLSPHPAAIVLAHLLMPLTELGLEQATATVIEPVSMFGDRGLEDLLEQTRDILSMTGEQRPSVFERQLAFNLYPTPAPSSESSGSSGALAALVRSATGGEILLAVHAVQGPVFHGLATSLFVRFPGGAEDPGEATIRERLAAHPHVSFELREVDGPEPGPIDVAAREEVLVGSVRADSGAPGGYWIWAVMDNLTRGGALNAVEVAEHVTGNGS